MRHRTDVAEEATGCVGAGSYSQYARAHGYAIVKVFDWTSSAGDWVFLISRNGLDWQLLFQTNNYPRFGFTHTIDPRIWVGTFEEVCQQMADELS
jgi:hypothetical protein